MPYSLFVCEDPVNGSSSDNSVPDSVAVFQQIRSVVQKMCASEKRRWHHRPCYLLAWIEHRVFGDSEAAKQTLLPLLQMRNQTKQLASFYKTDSELPGKHYLYLEKYLSLYIDTLIATADIDSVTLLRRKLKRSSEALYDPSVLQAKTNTAYVLVLQQLVVRLNCPKFVVDEEGKEHIILQKSLEGAQAVRVYPVTRHCRLNRPVFNHVRDMALSNITHFVELGEHLRGALRTLEKQQQQESSAASTVVGTVRTSVAAVEEYLVDAVRAIELFELVLDEKKKHTDEPLALGQLADMLADLFIRILHRYGQVKRVIHPPPYQEGDMAELIEFCNRSTAMLLPSGADGKSESQRNTEGGSFWHDIIFDASRNETSQLYKLLDPLLEFSINRLLDAVRSAKAQKTYVFSYKPRAEAVAILPPPMSAVVTQSTSTAAEQQSHPEQQPHQGTFQ
ncbi:Histone transcription regulator 3 [Linderina macrospora]|uniref:Histone transcription regulator 3 n=1 Tax=Linderina macrospora TaxID=4868 RepID=A0ACC1J7D5_9FUNG|nr:Histone transcription regulator 3 [Linderina macrospora]